MSDLLKEELEERIQELEDGIEELGRELDEYEDEKEKFKHDSEELRVLFPKILKALDNGSVCTPDSTIEFLKEIPKEIELVIRNLKEENKRLKKFGLTIVIAFKKRKQKYESIPQT